jgi:hypothetical protein
MYCREGRVHTWQSMGTGERRRRIWAAVAGLGVMNTAALVPQGAYASEEYGQPDQFTAIVQYEDYELGFGVLLYATMETQGGNAVVYDVQGGTPPYILEDDNLCWSVILGNDVPFADWGISLGDEDVHFEGLTGNLSSGGIVHGPGSPDYQGCIFPGTDLGFAGYNGPYKEFYYAPVVVGNGFYDFANPGVYLIAGADPQAWYVFEG